MTFTTALQWERDDMDWPGDWYLAEQGGCTASLDMNKRRVFVHMSAPDATDFDLFAVCALMGSLGLAFPANSAELAYGVMTGECGSFAAGAEDGVWVFTTDF